MTSEDIRMLDIDTRTYREMELTDQIQHGLVLLQEIAAQLAELNEQYESYLKEKRTGKK